MTELKDLMRDMAARARTYDATEKAIKISRRRRLVTRTMTPAVVAVLATLGALTVRALPTATPPVPSHVAAPVACDLTRLPLPGEWAQSFARLTSPNGRFIGGHVATLDGADMPVIWDNGVPLLLPMSGHDVFFRQLADNGNAIGNYNAAAADELPRSFVWRDGQPTILKGGNTHANAFNSSWAVVGTVDGKGAIWRDPSKEPELLQVPKTTSIAIPISIDDTGQILGLLTQMHPTEREDELALWSPSGELRLHTRPAQLGKQWALQPVGFDRGAVVFWAINEENGETLVGRWDPRTNDYRMTARSGGATTAIADNGWRLVHEGDRSFVAGTASRVELVKPADADGRTAWSYYMTPDGRTIVTSLHLQQQGHIAAVMWRCR